jgi:hypothetical protein
MIPSVERVQQWVKEWAVTVDLEVDVQVLPPHDNPRESGQIIPIRLRRHGYEATIGFPERVLAGSALPEETRRTLNQALGGLRYMEARGLPRQRETG